jgi:hypothetical protein
MLYFWRQIAACMRPCGTVRPNATQTVSERNICVRSRLQTLNPHFKPQPKTGPLEIEADEIVRNVEVYTLSKESYYRQFGWFMGLCSGLFAYMTHVAYLAFQRKPRVLKEQARLVEEGQTKLNSLDRLVHFCYDHNYAIAACTALIGASTFAVGFMFPVRVIRKLTLLRGGKTIEFDTFYPFAFTALRRTVRVPVQNVRGVKFGRARSRVTNAENSSEVAYSVFKVRSRPFLYYLDRREGVFLNRVYFDNYVGLQRNFK